MTGARNQVVMGGLIMKDLITDVALATGVSFLLIGMLKMAFPSIPWGVAGSLTAGLLLPLMVIKNSVVLFAFGIVALVSVGFLFGPWYSLGGLAIPAIVTMALWIYFGIDEIRVKPDH